MAGVEDAVIWINLALVAIAAVGGAVLIVRVAASMWRWLCWLLMSDAERDAHEYGGTVRWDVDDDRLP